MGDDAARFRVAIYNIKTKKRVKRLHHSSN